MSEADSPNDQSGSPAPTEPTELTAASDAATAELSNPSTDAGWQTIDFPGAMSINAIPCGAVDSVEQRFTADGLDTPIAPGVIHYGNAEIGQPGLSFAISAETSNESALRQQLQDENAALRDRLAQVELDLVQQQIEWQLESAHTQFPAKAAADRTDYAAEPATTIAQPSTVEPTDERLHQLLQALERSRQAAQRQQILVETLTEQLESSQERIAQLERDCALTQQRHNEQVQQVLQAEGACRDLRLRLHRQQQQTLQFKAALEKCLEMPTVYGQQVMPDIAIDDSAETSDAFAALLQPKNQPVKPWSLPQRAADELESGQTELPKPLFKLLNGRSATGAESNGLPANEALARGFKTPFGQEDERNMPLTPAEPSALLESDDPEFVTHLMQLIFPDTAEQQVYTAADTLQAEPIFELSPLIGAENAPMPPVEPSQDECIPLERSSTWAAVPLEMIAAEPPQPNALQNDVVTPSHEAIANIPTPALPVDRSTDPLGNGLQAVDLPETPTSTKIDADAHSESGGAQSSTDTTPDAVGLVPVENRSVQAVPATKVGITPLFTASPVKSSPLADAVDLNSVTDRASDSAAKPIAAWTWRDRLANASPAPRSAVPEAAAQNPTKLLALSFMGRQAESRQAESQQPASVVSRTAPPPAAFSTLIPSPIVYPLRSTKKLASLAAVDLPTFPKR